MVRPLGILHRSGVDMGTTTRGFIQFLLQHPHCESATELTETGSAAEVASSRGPAPGGSGRSPGVRSAGHKV
jgi:hypothetical protein